MAVTLSGKLGTTGHPACSENWAPLGTRSKTGAQFEMKLGTRKSAGQSGKGAHGCPVFPLLRRGARNLPFSLTRAQDKSLWKTCPTGHPMILDIEAER